MRYLIVNHSAATPHNGHTFSDSFLPINWTGLYRQQLKFIPKTTPILFMDPFGKWPDQSQGNQYATLFDQWFRCHTSFNEDNTAYVADVNQFGVLARVRATMTFKIGYIPPNATRLWVYENLYPFVRTFACRPVGSRPTICIDALVSEDLDHELRDMVVYECWRLGFPVMAEGWLRERIPRVTSTLLSWSALRSNGGIDNLSDEFGESVVIYAPEDTEHPMTMDDVLAIEEMGHSVAFTPDVWPEEEQ